MYIIEGQGKNGFDVIELSNKDILQIGCYTSIKKENGVVLKYLLQIEYKGKNSSKYTHYTRIATLQIGTIDVYRFSFNGEIIELKIKL